MSSPPPTLCLYNLVISGVCGVFLKMGNPALWSSFSKGKRDLLLCEAVCEAIVFLFLKIY
uniref:Uncharacterized protein n=1 Tax=Anguilla anguilla TaxID=7936 RepID=A0A0E9TJH7_ANGAN